MMSREHILLRLSTHNHVIHSTPPRGRHISAPPSGMIHIRNNLYHYTNPKLLPEVYRFPQLEYVFNRFRSIHRRSILRSLSCHERPVLYLWHPFFSDEIGRYRERLVIYHVYDDYSTLPGSKHEWVEREKAILCRADIVFVINEKLMHKLKSLVNREYIHLPQGVDFSIFDQARKQHGHIPPDLASIRSPRIGYIGRINGKVDLDLIHTLAVAKENWSFVFIGPIDPSTEIRNALNKLVALGNVHFLGAKQFTEIPHYWMHLNAAIVPYLTRPGQWAHYGSPLKLREGFAAGIPLVVSALDDYKPISHLLRIASSEKEWLQEISAALETDSNNPLLIKGMAYAAENSWDNRVETVRTLISKHLSQ